MTLRELIDRYESAQPAPVTITPLGAAHVAAHRFARAIAVLPTEERIQVNTLLCDLLWKPAPTDPELSA